MRIISLLLTICLVGCGGGGTSAPDPVTIPSTVFIGDSITYAWPLAQDFSGETDVGIAGQTSADMLARFDADVIAHHPQIVVILAGTNDMLRVTNPTTDNIAEMASRASAAGIRVALCTIPPIANWSMGVTITDPTLGNATVAAFNESLVNLAHAYSYSLADYHAVLILPDGSQNGALFVDGVHPDDAGYAVMTKIIAPLL